VFDIDTAQIQYGKNDNKIQIRLVLSPPDPSQGELTLHRSYTTKLLYEFPFDLIKLFCLDWCAG
jgi:hypothetical protein